MRFLFSYKKGDLALLPNTTQKQSIILHIKMGQKRYTNIIIYNTFSIIIQELNTHIIMFTAHIKDLFTKKKKKRRYAYISSQQELMEI